MKKEKKNSLYCEIQFMERNYWVYGSPIFEIGSGILFYGSPNTMIFDIELGILFQLFIDSA